MADKKIAFIKLQCINLRNELDFEDFSIDYEDRLAGKEQL